MQLVQVHVIISPGALIKLISIKTRHTNTIDINIPQK